jgi:hypothetical protein
MRPAGRVAVVGLAIVVLRIVDVGVIGAGVIGAGVVGCGGDVCDPALDEAVRAVRAVAPNFAAAKKRTDRVFIEGHGTASLTGFGVSLVEVEHAPSPAELLPHDVPARGPLDEPSLLFFEKTAGPEEEWPLVGFGYHRDFTPCAVPVLHDRGKSIGPDGWFIHEAGWHHVPTGDGGFTAATAATVKDGVVFDEAGCSDVTADDLQNVQPLFVPHGRSWTAQVWFADNTCPVVALTDPFGRDACVEQSAGCGDETRCDPSLAVAGRAFFAQGDCRAVCEGTPP